MAADAAKEVCHSYIVINHIGLGPSSVARIFPALVQSVFYTKKSGIRRSVSLSVRDTLVSHVMNQTTVTLRCRPIAPYDVQ